MTISLSVGGTTIALSDDLLWTDEFTWTPVEQSIETSITGALLVQVGSLLAGRSITLQPEDDSSAWMSGAVLNQLRTWAQNPGQVMVLTIRGVARDVIFRHQERALEVTKVVHYSDLQDTDRYLLVIRLMEVAT